MRVRTLEVRQRVRRGVVVMLWLWLLGLVAGGGTGVVEALVPQPGAMNTGLRWVVGLVCFAAGVGVVGWYYRQDGAWIWAVARQYGSWRRVRGFGREHRRLQRAGVVALGVFLVCTAMLGRTAWIRTNDLFHFGQYERWWCYSIVHWWHLGGSVDTYAPGVKPRHHGPAQDGVWPRWYWHHIEANGGTWALSGGPGPAVVSQGDWWVYGYQSFSDGGVYHGSLSWVDLGGLVPLLHGVSGALLVWWGWRYRQFVLADTSGRCLQCDYDLRAHAAGQRCPECGAVIESVGGTVEPVRR